MSGAWCLAALPSSYNLIESHANSNANVWISSTGEGTEFFILNQCCIWASIVLMLRKRNQVCLAHFESKPSPKIITVRFSIRTPQLQIYIFSYESPMRSTLQFRS
jgi:hypothetical protein